MDNTKIEWAESTWNPVTGCYHGCPYCYARTIVRRFGAPDVKKVIRVEMPEHYTGVNGKKIAYPTGFTPTLHRYKLDEVQKWKKPRTIFVCSMADLFGEWVPDSWIKEVFAACEKAPQHRYLFLTKNPSRYVALAEAGKLPERDNMWYGTTATTPNEMFFFDEDWNTFVSIEPIQEDFGEVMRDVFAKWVIIGAETGNRKKKVIPEANWIKGIIKTCAEKNIALMMKESLLPIVGEENMVRELPWDEKNLGNGKKM